MSWGDDVTVLTIRLCPEDLDQFGGPEVLRFDLDALKDLPAGELIAIEDETNLYLGAVAQIVERRGASPDVWPAQGRKAVVWLARRLAGLKDDWVAFEPRLLRARIETEVEAEVGGVQAGPGGPPDGLSVDGSAQGRSDG